MDFSHFPVAKAPGDLVKLRLQRPNADLDSDVS